MALYDQHGKKMSDRNPSISEIKKGFEGLEKRDMSKYSEWSHHAVHPAEIGRINNRTLRHLYSVSSSVRPAVDGITRQVAHLQWGIFHKDMKFHPPAESIELVEFFEHPNADNEDLATILSKYINDLLTIGKGAIEKVRNINGKVVELVTRDASVIRPKIDAFGNIVAYEELKRDTSTTVIATHPKNNFIFRYFTPSSYTMGTIPIIETIVNEVALLMLSIKAIAWAFTKDEIPPGLLHLGEIGEEALERARASFEAARSVLGENKIRIIDGVDQVNWIQFTRPFREMQLAELMPLIERIVARNFGLSPVETLSDSTARNTDLGIKMSNSRLILPIVRLITFDMNMIVNEIDRSQKFKFISVPEEKLVEISASLIAQWRSGLATTNEVRIALGRPPVQGGDIRTVLLGNEVVAIGDDGLPLRGPRPPVMPPGQSPFRPGAVRAADLDEFSEHIDEATFRQLFDLPDGEDKWN